MAVQTASEGTLSSCSDSSSPSSGTSSIEAVQILEGNLCGWLVFWSGWVCLGGPVYFGLDCGIGLECHGLNWKGVGLDQVNCFFFSRQSRTMWLCLPLLKHCPS